MNGESYRGSQPSGGRVINRSGATSGGGNAPYRAAEEPYAGGGALGGDNGSGRGGVPQPALHRGSGKAGKPRRGGRGLMRILAIVVIILLVIFAGWFAWEKFQNQETAVDTSKYQAVFLTNGQFYFGKLQKLNDGYMKLSDVYYMQTDSSSSNTSSSAAASTSTSDSNYKLIKLGSEIHGPEDAMMIAKDQILYYENIKPDGKVGQLIKQDSGK